MLIESSPQHPVEYSFQILDCPDIIHYANHSLKATGILYDENSSSYCYLKLDNAYIADIFPLLQANIKSDALMMPDYFTAEKNNIGAHISLVYPQETNAAKVCAQVKLYSPPLVCHFNVNEMISVTAFNKTFYALTVSCDQLEQIRLQHGLSQKLNYHDLWLPFHITVAVTKNT